MPRSGSPVQREETQPLVSHQVDFLDDVKECARASNSSIPDNKKDFLVSCVEAPTESGCPTSPDQISIREAAVIAKGRPGHLIFNSKTSTIKIVQSKPNGKTRVILYVPIYLVLNIESNVEKDARQRMHQANDGTAKAEFAERGDSGASLLCNFPAANGAAPDDSLVFSHSRQDTGVTTFAGSSGSSGVRPGSMVKYFIHYVRHRKGQTKTIHTLEFHNDGAQDEALLDLMDAALHSIYQREPKHILFFISPKSGQGKGKEIFDKYVRPVLHFTRHTYEVYVTKRAHDCEDYIADIENKMNADTVVTMVGGDGMMHEAVNGLYRRKCALVEFLRRQSESQEPCTSESPTALSPRPAHQQSPLYYMEQTKQTRRHILMDIPHALSMVQTPTAMAKLLVEKGWRSLIPSAATIATGSACGLAKSLDVLRVLDATLAVVHTNTCPMDLMKMSFLPNEDMLQHQTQKMGTHKLRSAHKKFSSYLEKNRAELRERSEARAVAVSSGAVSNPMVSPFLKDGTPEYRDPVSFEQRMPHFDTRIAFMSLSFGIANDIDHGSEHLRWMGNARFAIYGGYAILRGLKKYRGVLRYLPWESREGLKVEKLHNEDKMPSPDDFPVCTMHADCPHCQKYQHQHCEGDHGAMPRDGDSTDAAALLAPYSDAQLLDEDAVDFDDDSLNWTTIRGEFYSILFCNIRDVAQDMQMAPLSHMSDGAIDVVYARLDPVTGKGGRLEMLRFFGALESGEHVREHFVNYVKARALEIKIDMGISMSDGELMPFSTARITKIRDGVEWVRSE